MGIAFGSARAEDTGRARAQFEAGRALYRVGNYKDALRAFQLGYEHAPLPLFHINIGQCQRKLRDPVEAKRAYERFLKEAPADAPERAQVQEIVRDLEREIAALPPAPPPAPAPAPVVAQPAAPAVAVVATPEPPPHGKKTSFIRRHWWIIPVTVVVVGAAVTTGAVLGTQGGRTGCNDPGVLGCLP